MQPLITLLGPHTRSHAAESFGNIARFFSPPPIELAFEHAEDVPPPPSFIQAFL